MLRYRHLELLRRGSASVVRLLNHRPLGAGEVAELTSEWNTIADCADCRSLRIDCSQVTMMSSDLLSRLVVLQRRLKQKEGKLILCGLCPEVREVFRWTKLDHFFEIRDNEGQEAVALA